MSMIQLGVQEMTMIRIAEYDLMQYEITPTSKNYTLYQKTSLREYSLEELFWQREIEMAMGQ